MLVEIVIERRRARLRGADDEKVGAWTFEAHRNVSNESSDGTGEYSAPFAESGGCLRFAEMAGSPRMRQFT